MAEAKDLNKVASMKSAIAQADNSLPDLLQSMVIYAHALTEYDVSFSDTLMNWIAEDIISSCLLSSESRSSCVHYVPKARLERQHAEFFHFSQSLIWKVMQPEISA